MPRFMALRGWKAQSFWVAQRFTAANVFAQSIRRLQPLRPEAYAGFMALRGWKAQSFWVAQRFTAAMYSPNQSGGFSR
jgi:hypothetical protein